MSRRSFPNCRSKRSGSGGIPPGSSAATAYWEAAVEYPTLVDGAVSDLPDIISTNNATQGTAANRPILSRADNRENIWIRSEDFVTSWTAEQATQTNNAVANPVDGAITAASLLETAVSNVHGANRSGLSLIAGIEYRFSIYVKIIGSDRVLRFLLLSGGAFSTDGEVRLDATGTITQSTNVNTSSVDSLGDGWFRLTCTKTANASSTTVVYTRILLAPGTGTYLGDITKGLYLYGLQVSRISASSTYLATTTFPQYAGINGNAVPVFDGSNDSLATTIAVNPTGGMWGAVFVRPQGSPIIVLSAYTAVTANRRLQLYTASNGSITLQVYNGTNHISRVAPAATFALGEAFILSFTYDGGTLATGIKIYKNGVQVDTTTATSGVYTVPTAGANLEIGADNLGTANFFNGYLSPAVFGQGSTWADADRQATEQDLRTKYIPNYVWFNPANNVTSSSGAVASWTDVTNTYVASQSTAANRPTVSTLNGQVAFLYDGSNDSLATNLAVNPTGGMAGVVVVRPSTVAAAQRLLAARPNTASDRLIFFIAADGSLNCRVASSSTDFIIRGSAASALVANTAYVLSFTYDGTTAATGIKVYRNGTQIDTTTTTGGTYAVPTAGANLRIGADDLGSYMNGYIADAFFVQGRQMSDSERQGWESRFMTQYGVS